MSILCNSTDPSTIRTAVIQQLYTQTGGLVESDTEYCTRYSLVFCTKYRHN